MPSPMFTTYAGETVRTRRAREEAAGTYQGVLDVADPAPLPIGALDLQAGHGLAPEDGDGTDVYQDTHEWTCLTRVCLDVPVWPFIHTLFVFTSSSCERG